MFAHQPSFAKVDRFSLTQIAGNFMRSLQQGPRNFSLFRMLSEQRASARVRQSRQNMIQECQMMALVQTPFWNSLVLLKSQCDCSGVSFLKNPLFLIIIKQNHCKKEPFSCFCSIGLKQNYKSYVSHPIVKSQ